MEHKDYITISEKVAHDLNNHLELFCNRYPSYKTISTEYTKKRIHLNGIQFYSGFKASKSNTNIEKYYKIPIAIECIMLMAYKTNRILDHKQEVWSSENKLKDTVLDEKMYLSMILTLLRDSKKILGKKYFIVKELILQLISDINEGFWYEKNNLNVNFSPIKTVLKDWKNKYKKRNILFNGVYDYASLIGYYIGSGDSTIFEKYEYYFKDKGKLSHLGQIINDLSDYSSIYDENVKSYQDAFSDLRNGIITQPTFILIKEKCILDAIKNPLLTKDVVWRKKILSLLTKKKVVMKIQKITKEGYCENIDFWVKVMHTDYELLFYTYTLLSKNKYYKDLSLIK